MFGRGVEGEGGGGGEKNEGVVCGGGCVSGRIDVHIYCRIW